MRTSCKARRWSRGLVVALVALACCAPGRATLRRSALELPEPFAHRPAQPVRVLRVRAYADEEYRSESPSWRARIFNQVERANAVAEEEFGVRFEVESVREWKRTIEPGSLQHVLDVLVREDPGFDVDWVVGFVGPPIGGERSRDAIGRAQPFGHHFVVRAKEPLAAHALFLHEWAHTLGAVHDCSGHWSMSESGSERSAFSPESAWLVRLGLHHRDARGVDARREWATQYGTGVGRIMAVWPECRAMGTELRSAQRLLDLATHAWVEPRNASDGCECDPWFGAFAAPLAERLNSAAEQVKKHATLPPHAPVERVVVVSVGLDRSGAVKDVRVLLGSDLAPLDDAVAEVFRVQRYPHPPAQSVKDDRYGFTYSFKVEL